MRSRNHKSQSGITIFGFLFTLLILVILALLFMKLFPPYFENHKVQEALTKLAEEPNAGTMSKRQIVNQLKQILYIDYADEIVDFSKATTLVRKDKSTEVRVDYEVVVPLVYNASALLQFENDIELPKR